MKNKGFTLPELMISMAIMSIIVALTFPAFTDLLTFTKGETASEEAQIDKLISLELIRLDLENVAYGIARDAENSPISLTVTQSANPPVVVTRTLQLNSTLNNTNQSTIGWILYNCSPGENLRDHIMTDTHLVSNTNIVLLDHNKNFHSLSTTTQGSCPATRGIYTAFPYDGVNSCTPEFCTSVSYRLSASNLLSTCAAGTRNLLRAVGNAAGDPVINCVADFMVTFAVDENGDGDLDDRSDDTQATTLPDTTAKIRSQVKNINMYILMQEGVRDNNLNNTNVDLNISAGVVLSLANVKDPEKYRWKVVRISGKPMSM